MRLNIQGVLYVGTPYGDDPAYSPWGWPMLTQGILRGQAEPSPGKRSGNSSLIIN